MVYRNSLNYHLAQLHLGRALKPYLRSKKFIIAIVIPENVDFPEWITVADEMIKPACESDDFDNRKAHSESRVDTVSTLNEATDGFDNVSFGTCRTVILINHEFAEYFLEHPSTAAADAIIRIDAISVPFMQRAVQNAFGSKITEDEAFRLTKISAKRRKVATRAGRNLTLVLDALEHAEKRNAEAEKPKKAEDGQRLEDMYGYGEAKVWGMELARDVADFRAGLISWADVDNGLLLSGPPGCGKTTFAAALARTCNMDFVVGSYASWQSRGHQGDMLKAMRAAFANARSKAPCVLLIDEIDGFVERGTGHDAHNNDYMRGVVNGLLEELDGAKDRDGVVVIGACNDPKIIDPALLRPGRLDRHVAIQLPDAQARLAILQGHLGTDLNLQSFVESTSGMSGADLERVARDARRLARRERTAVSIKHVSDALPMRVRRSDDHLRRIAVHEIGHAFVCAFLNCEPLEYVVIEPFMNPTLDSQAAGYAAFRESYGKHKNAQYYADRICMLLAGMACDHLITGSHDDGAVLDLVEATTRATFILASFGMGDTLASSGHFDANEMAKMRAIDPALSRRVEDLLQDQLERAKDILKANRGTVEFLIEQLIKHEKLPGEFIYSAIQSDQKVFNFG